MDNLRPVRRASHRIPAAHRIRAAMALPVAQALAAAIALAVSAAGCAVAGRAAGTPAGSASASPHHKHRKPDPPKPPPVAKVVIRRLRLRDGDLVTLARFTGGVRFVLHNGRNDPGRRARRLVHAGSVIGPRERPRLVAAFNGGFKLSAGAGGYEQEGHVISPLLSGRASLVIYASGAVGIGAWGQSVPQPGQQVYSVRQNLRLLVSGGHPTRVSRDWAQWGATLTGTDLVARSAVGENATGQLIYAASMSASPADLAAALARAGAVTAMELDINPQWVQLAFARHPGGRLHRGIPGQARPADQYLKGWIRDYMSVLTITLPPAPVSPVSPATGSLAPPAAPPASASS